MISEFELAFEALIYTAPNSIIWSWPNKKRGKPGIVATPVNLALQKLRQEMSQA